MYLESSVGKINKLERIKLGSSRWKNLKLERTVGSWKAETKSETISWGV